MNSDVVTGRYGDASLDLDHRTGVLSWDGKDVILMRVDLINRIFGSVMDVPMFSALLRRSGVSAGEEYAVTWLLGAAPSPQMMSGGSASSPVPDTLRGAWSAYSQAQRSVEADPRSEERAREVEHRWRDIRSGLAGWLSMLQQPERLDLWQRMHELDVYGGWGRADVTELRPELPLAHISVRDSFIGRLTSYWERTTYRGRPVCSFLEGYFLGEAHIMLGSEDLICVEEACHIEGNPTCRFVIERDPTVRG